MRVLRIFYAWDNDNTDKQIYAPMDSFLGVMQLKPYRKMIRKNYVNAEAREKGMYYVDNTYRSPRVFVKVELLSTFLEDNYYWRNYNAMQKKVCETLSAILEYDQKTFLDNSEFLKKKHIRITVPKAYFQNKPKEEEIYYP